MPPDLTTFTFCTQESKASLSQLWNCCLDYGLPPRARLGQSEPNPGCGRNLPLPPTCDVPGEGTCHGDGGDAETGLSHNKGGWLLSTLAS